MKQNKAFNFIWWYPLKRGFNKSWKKRERRKVQLWNNCLRTFLNKKKKIKLLKPRGITPALFTTVSINFMLGSNSEKNKSDSYCSAKSFQQWLLRIINDAEKNIILNRQQKLYNTTTTNWTFCSPVKVLLLQILQMCVLKTFGLLPY